MIAKDTAITVEGVSKLYRIGATESSEDSLGATLFKFVKSPLKNYRKYRSLYDFSDVEKNENEEVGTDSSVIWALKDLSFKVKAGEVIGIIGTNGAGKSTLLKILARITPPTKGRIEIRGRISSLLEVGTGFHQELTGRENIYLNGTILGMKKREVDQKYDEIVEFSGVEKFLGTPVKRYSSGMRVRLAFAVAAHLEPEILIIDEVLAVGDANFQKKCLNKMQDVGQHGRTVLFVSHNMPAVTRLCERVVLLNEGKLLQDGSAQDVVHAYLHAGHGISAVKEWYDLMSAPGSSVVRLTSVRIKDEKGETCNAADIRRAVGIEMEYEVLEEGHLLMPYYNILNDEGVKICTAQEQDDKWRHRQRPTGHYISTAWIPGNLLNEGTIYVGPAMREWDSNVLHFHQREAIAFQVIDSLEGDSTRGDYSGHLGGVVRPQFQWETEFSKNGSNGKKMALRP